MGIFYKVASVDMKPVAGSQGGPRVVGNFLTAVSLGIQEAYVALPIPDYT